MGKPSEKISDMPNEIVEAAHKISEWMTMKGYPDLEVHGISVRIGQESLGLYFFITLPEEEPMRGEEHQEGSHELAEARVHVVGQIALPRGRKQIHVREVLL